LEEKLYREIPIFARVVQAFLMAWVNGEMKK